MTEVQLSEVVAIERECFDNPWTVSQFKGELDNSVSHFFVERATAAEGGRGDDVEGGPERDDDGPICGYLIFWIVSGEAHILNLCVAPWARRGGGAHRMVDFALAMMVEGGVFEVFLEVRASNEAALKLYESYGFDSIYTRRRYYGDEDAQVMSLRLTDGEGVA